MASSARWFGRLRAALGHVSPASMGSKGTGCLGCAKTAMKELPPPGYVLTSSGLFVPDTRRGLKKIDRCLDRIESGMVERAERGFGLFFRLTSVCLGTSACVFLARLSWYESTDSGVLQNYLPGSEKHNHGKGTGQEGKALTTEEIKKVVEQVSQAQLLQFNKGLATARQAQSCLMEYVDSHVKEHRQILESKGLNPEQVKTAQVVFLHMIIADAEWKFSQTHTKDSGAKQAVAETK